MKFRSEREKRLVVGGGSVAAVLLYLGLLIMPGIDHIHAYQRDLRTQRVALEDARRLAGELIGLKAQGAAVATVIQGTPPQVVKRVVSQLNIPVASERDFGAGNRGVELRTDEVSGDALIRLLFSLQQAGIHPDSMELHDTKGQGLWTVKLTINPPSGTP